MQSLFNEAKDLKLSNSITTFVFIVEVYINHLNMLNGDFLRFLDTLKNLNVELDLLLQTTRQTK